MILGGNTPDPAKVAITSKTTAKLAAPVSINGVAFDGSASITINATDSIARIASSEKGAASGVCPLGSDSKVPSAYLPSYVDDVLEYANLAAFPVTGETGKIYVSLDTNYEYRWSGSFYVRLVASPGTTDALTEGTTNLYFTAARVLAVVLSGLSTATSAAITAGDSILSALGKLQAQINGKEPAITAGTSAQYFKGDKSLGTFATDALTAAPAETATTTGALISGATAKTTPVDADAVGISDSAASGVLKNVTWANIKATLKTYFDGLYPSGSGTCSGTNTGDQTNISGNAGTATKLATARAINGVNFDGSAAITITDDTKAAATQPAWTAATLLNGWSYGGGFSAAGYMKDTVGTVYLKGDVQPGSAGVIFTLPLGYRPSDVRIIPIVTGGGGFAYAFIATNGDVSASVGLGRVILDGVSFKP